MSTTKAVFLIALFLTGIFLGMNLAPVTGMPIQSVTPEQAAAIFVQPLKDEMNGLKADLVSGEIDNERYLNQMELLKLKVEMKLLLLEAVRDSEQPYNKKMELLFGILPWTVRTMVNHEASKKAINNMK